jgi:hypothetical protein
MMMMMMMMMMMTMKNAVSWDVPYKSNTALHPRRRHSSSKISGCCLLHAGYVTGLPFGHEDGGICSSKT